jgi:organic hydroperoxide reductase OsmC/OhrA
LKNTTKMLFASLVLVAGLAACNNTAEKTTAADSKMEAKAVNTTCPFTGETVDGKTYAVHDGKKVAFCCAGCKAKFEKMDDAKQDAMVAKAK